MRHAALTKSAKPGSMPEEVIMIIPTKDAQALVDMAEAACKANPRKGTWKRLLKELEQLECWT